MHTYAQFCKHYGLDPRSKDARHQYREYQVNFSILESIVTRADRPARASVPKSPLGPTA